MSCVTSVDVLAAEGASAAAAARWGVWRLRARLGSGPGPEERRVRAEAETYAFLARLGLDPERVLPSTAAPRPVPAP